MKKRMKKATALFLSAVMTAGMLAGCGGKDAGNDSQNAGNENSGAGDNVETQDSNVNSDAAAGNVDLSEHMDLKMYLVGDVPDGIDDVYAEINKILEEKLNCSVSVDWLSWGDHDTTYSLLFSGGEDFDMIFTATSWCHYEQTVGMKGFQALSEELLQTYAPDIWEMMPEVAWNQAMVDGNIYMIPANFVEVTPDVVAIRGDLVEKYGYDDIDSWDDLIAFYKDCAADGMYGNAVGAGSLYWIWFEQNGYSVVSGAPSEGELVLYHSADAQDTEVKYILDWDEFDQYCREVKELADANCWPSDVLSSTQDRQTGLLNGRGASMVWNTGSCQIYANEANGANPDWNVNIYNIMPDVKYGATKYINGGIGFNANSKKLERAMMVINEFATNPQLQDLAQLGIEGVHWEAVGDDQYKVIGSGYAGSNYWGWRNNNIMRTQYRDNPTDVDIRTDELNEYFLSHIREDHALDGFSFDTTPVSVQYAAVEAAMGTYHDPLLNGLVDDVDGTLEAYRAAMEAAGIRDVLDEMQKQIDAFLAER